MFARTADQSACERRCDIDELAFDVALNGIAGMPATGESEGAQGKDARKRRPAHAPVPKPQLGNAFVFEASLRQDSDTGDVLFTWNCSPLASSIR